MISSSEGKESEVDQVALPKKKLKQARLSFQKLSPGLEMTSPKNVKKRKISDDSSDDVKVLKVVKTSENSDALEDGVTSRGNEPLECISNKEVDEEQDVHVKSGKAEKSNEECNIEPISCKEKLLLSNIVPEKENVNSTEVMEVDDDSDNSDSTEEVSDNETEFNCTADINSSGSCVNESVSLNDSATSSLRDSPEKSITKSIAHDDEESRKRKLTPKQMKRYEEAAKRKEEREKQRKVQREMKAKEKEVKHKEKLEKEEKKKKEKEEKEEQKRKEKEEKEEQKRKEKEEKEKKRQAELELKSEEKRLKEEEKRKKEELRVLEKKKKGEKKIAEEEAKKKEAAAFVNFFVSAKSCSKSSEDTKICAENFMPFQVKVDMRLAPSCRTNFTTHRSEDLEKLMEEQSQSELYLAQLKKKAFMPGKNDRTWSLLDFRESTSQEEEDDVIFIAEENKVVELHPSLNQPKPKLLQFCENRRPPYWGTWRKKSQRIKPTCPFLKDECFFDYEVDSDEEWEEEEPGESLHGSDDEKESEDEYEVDNEFFVPHGYLSEEENDCEEDSVSPETMKAKLKFMEMEFEEEMKHKTERVKPRLFGCYWMNKDTDVGSRILGMLNSYRAVFKETSIPVCAPASPNANSPVSESRNTNPSSCSKRKKFPESVVPDLIKLVHGNINGRGFLVKEFSAYLKTSSVSSKEELNTSENDLENTPVHARASKLSIANKIKQIASWIACPEEGPFLNRMCWYISPEIRSAYGLEDLVIPNKAWNYIITPKRELELSNTIPSPSISEARHRSLPLITKFTKRMTQEERQKQLMSSQNNDDIEIIDDTNLAKPLTLPEKTSQEMPVDSNYDTMKNDGKIPSKQHTTTTKIASKGSPNSYDLKQKLLSFKAKTTSNASLNQRKRVPILMSVPLGQSIASSASKPSNEKNKKSSIDDMSENGTDKECILIE